ncbi:hypothetical protein C2G38_2267332 [Gigaspora rosea]|uniref:Galactose oxidase n=1 Tax=Gigaspora rosea TaxID=44941 RepID=A0A397UH61_9GLOM|nr:hypothetical protein C2G38_2267332 [Gigaspora rosea]
MEHISVLVDKKLYFSCGYNHDQDEILNVFFYLDVSQSFNISALPWNDLTFTGATKNLAASACSGENNNDLFIFGGFSALGDPYSIVVKYDINNQNWTDITNDGNEPAGRNFISCAKFNNRSIAFSVLPLYDTASDSWKRLKTSDPTPPSRVCFSAVLTSDKRIIIFGGHDEDGNVLGDLWILDIATNQWSTGNISNPNGLTLWAHTATLVDNYMIVAFGSNDTTYSSSAIYMLDVSKRDSYTWVTDFIPSTPNTTNFK